MLLWGSRFGESRKGLLQNPFLICPGGGPDRPLQGIEFFRSLLNLRRGFFFHKRSRAVARDCARES